MGLFEDERERLRKELVRRYESMTGHPPPPDYVDSVSQMMKAYGGIWVEKRGFSLTQVFVAFIVPMLIFFPFDLQRMLIPLFVILIILLVLAVFSGTFVDILVSAGIGSLEFIFKDIIPGLAVILILLIATQFLNCGSQSCFWVVSTRFGTLGALVAFFVVLAVFLLLAFFTKGITFYILTAIVGFLLLFSIIPLLSPQKYYSFCKQTFLYDTVLCKVREVRVDPLKTVKIPVTGGINVKIETPSTLYAGEPYEFAFTLTNFYERPISFNLKPSAISSYGSNIEFSQPYHPKTPELKAGEYYQDSIYLDPNEMTIEEGTCPYATEQLAVAHNIKPEEVVCSHDIPCGNQKSACAKLDIFECDCLDWAKATCSKNPLKMKLYVSHSAFFLGNSSLYYSEEITSPAYGVELTQGPLRVTTEFQPNPYIASIHQYRQDVNLYVVFKNFGGTITIKDFKVEPQNTVIHTIDKEKQIELIEEVGTEVISCRDINEILPGGKLRSGEEIGGKLCTLKPPSVKTTLIDLETNEVKEVNNVTFSFISYFCSKKKPEEGEPTGMTAWSKNWDNIYKAVDESGLCEILNKKDEKNIEKQTVQKALSYVNVLIEFNYDRSAEYYSQEVTPYTRTEECIKLQESSAAQE
jgi:hypothetical protein